MWVCSALILRSQYTHDADVGALVCLSVCGGVPQRRRGGRRKPHRPYDAATYVSRVSIQKPLSHDTHAHTQHRHTVHNTHPTPTLTPTPTTHIHSRYYHSGHRATGALVSTSQLQPLFCSTAHMCETATDCKGAVLGVRAVSPSTRCDHTGSQPQP